ncbi:MAG: thioesterase II family protein [Frankia sp.]
MIGVTVPPARTSRYLPDVRSLAPPVRTRLFCFHHAGGTASVYADWRAGLRPEIALLPVQLPGREYRVHDKRIVVMDQLFDELARELGPLLEGPFAFYGHSMGATVAYGFARHLRDTGGPAPEALVLGACPPPDLSHPAATAEIPDQAALGRWMAELGGVPDGLLRSPEWLAASTALLRDDLVLTSTYRHREGGPLRCPIHVLAGQADPILPPDQAGRWREHTTAECTVHLVPGGHFFHREQPDRLVALLNQLLRQPTRT